MDLRYPIGKFSFDPAITPDTRRTHIANLASLPSHVEAALASLPPGALDTPYRDGGWTVRQVVHHLADSHINAYIRLKLALTESDPLIKTYEESLWATLPDATTADPVISLALLRALHSRMVTAFESLTPEQFARTARHPEWGPISIDWMLQMYSWHGRHHVGHVDIVRRAAVS